MTDFDGNWLEALLKRKNFEESTIRILDVKTADAVGRWENYQSKIKRVKAKVLLGSGKTRIISVIVKNEHSTFHLKNLSALTGIFRREILMYRDILPKMDELREEFGDTEDSLWAKCLETRPFNQLVFEDLSMAGYKVADRIKLLDLNASLLVLKKIAKFHALSKILLERSEISPETMYQNVGVGSRDQRMLETNAINLVETMSDWGDEWKPAIERLEKAAPGLLERSSKAKEGDLLSDFVVLNHGDCWTNNILFKYGLCSDLPTALKFVDMQVCFIGNPAADLHYFFITSVKVEVQQQYLNMMLETYYDSLTSHLLEFGFKGHLPSLEDLRENFFKTYVIQLAVSIQLTPFLTGIHDDDVPDLEEIISRELEAVAAGQSVPQVWNVFDRMTDATKSLVQYSIHNAMKFGVI